MRVRPSPRHVCLNGEAPASPTIYRKPVQGASACRHRFGGALRSLVMVLAACGATLGAHSAQAQLLAPQRQEIEGPAIIEYLYPGEPIVLEDWYAAELGVGFEPGVSGLYMGNSVGNGFYELRVHDSAHPATAGGLLVGSVRIDSSTPLEGVASLQISATGPTADGASVSISGTTAPSGYSLTMILAHGATRYVVAVGTGIDLLISAGAGGTRPSNAEGTAATPVAFGTNMFVPVEEQPTEAAATIVAQRHFAGRQVRYKVYYPGGSVPGGTPGGPPGGPGGPPPGGEQTCLNTCRVNLQRDIALANNAYVACGRGCLFSNAQLLAALAGCGTGAVLCPGGPIERAICCAVGAAVGACTQFGLCITKCAVDLQAAIDAAHINFVACAELCGVRVVLE